MPSARARSRHPCSWTGWSRTRPPSSSGWRATRPVALASRRRASTWPSISPRMNRAGRKAPRSSWTVASPSTTSELGRVSAMTEETPDMASSRIAICIDVGGSGIKAAVVDVESGRFRSDRIRVPTPSPSTPDAGLASVARVVKRLAKSSGLGDATPVGIGLPGVTIDGVLKSAANIDPSWVDFPVVERLTRVIGRRVTIINDADAAGIAEMRFGIGRDQPGVVIFLTLGTGVGSGVFVDGKLVPNTEFGQMEIRGRAAERRSAAAARIKRGLSWKAWAADLDEHLDRIQQLMWPNLMIIGGGVSKSADRFVPRLTVRCPIV